MPGLLEISDNPAPIFRPSICPANTVRIFHRVCHPEAAHAVGCFQTASTFAAARRNGYTAPAPVFRPSFLFEPKPPPSLRLRQAGQRHCAAADFERTQYDRFPDCLAPQNRAQAASDCALLEKMRCRSPVFPAVSRFGVPSRRAAPPPFQPARNPAFHFNVDQNRRLPRRLRLLPAVGAPRHQFGQRADDGCR